MKFEILDQNQNVVQTVETAANPVRIGKNASCELCLTDASVSRVHAVLEKSGNGYKLSDRMSTGGTFVNDQKVEPSKPAMISSGSVLRFGTVMVRVTLDEVPAEASVPAAAEASAPAPSAPPVPPTASAPSAPAAPPAPKPSLSKAPSVAPKAGGFGGGAAAFGGNTFSQSSGPATIIKKKKRPVSYERRFLSARSTKGAGTVEVAMVWRDTVLSVKSFPVSDGKSVSVGANSDCEFRVNAEVCGSPKITFLICSQGKWELMFNNSYEGFVLVGDQKTEFSAASNAVFPISRAGGQLGVGSMGHEMDGQTRAKFVFGEVSILVHSVDAVPYAAPLFGAFSMSNFGGLVASLLLHFALFSVILFATNRVDALMVDRILTTSRFAVVLEEPPVEEEQKEEQDEEEPEEEEAEEEDIQKDAQDTPFAANSNSDSSPKQTLSKAEAAAAAQATGLLAQSQAMNSMLSAGLDMQNLDNLDWSSFDASAQASQAGYGLGTTGSGGGGAGFGTIGGGGFGPGGAGGTGAIRAASADYNANLGVKGEAKPRVKMANPEVTGSLDKRIIQKVVRQHSGELRNCYEKELAKIKGLNGRVVAVWLISPQGSVSNAVVKESTIKNKNVENCVINSIKFWRFPSPKGGGAVKIEYPFVFDLSSN
ncbi:MAG: AgmX/PglI C-terminal domain-containing protein [Proteobacteria bacterium]|nr:AgmX/PglI C-terminal domain-containing protein [Pseudomonadota bacterium]